MKEDKLSKFWYMLQNQKEAIPLEDACKKAGLTWYSEFGGGCDELEEWLIPAIKKYQTKKFIKKIMRDKGFQSHFVMSQDFWKLNLLRTKTKHPAIKQLFGQDSTFHLLNWTEMEAIRRRT